MRKGDISQVFDIDREAFPTQWPPPSYSQELRNRLNRYLVAWEGDGLADEAPQAPAPEPPEHQKTPSFKAWLYQQLQRVRHLFDHNRFWGPQQTPVTGPRIVGYVGFVTVADESHINSIAVHHAYRRQGLGELLLASVIEISQELNVKTVSLEVRVTNEGAQALYRKYGFQDVGVRKAYYDDNREDGLLMVTGPIDVPSYQQRFRELKDSLEKRLDCH